MNEFLLAAICMCIGVSVGLFVASLMIAASDR